MENENTQNEMAEKLANAGKKAEEQKREARTRTVKGAHLLPQLKQLIEQGGYTQVEKSAFIKVTGSTKGKTVYVLAKGGRVDLSGFTIDDPAVTQITEQEAKDKHLGKVRGTLNFEASDEAVLSIFGRSLAELNVPFPEAPKATKPAPTPEAAATTENQPNAEG